MQTIPNFFMFLLRTFLFFIPNILTPLLRTFFRKPFAEGKLFDKGDQQYSLGQQIEIVNIINSIKSKYTSILIGLSNFSSKTFGNVRKK